MSEKPIVAYYAPVGFQSGEKVVGSINEAGFFCILCPVDLALLAKMGAKIGGSSAKFHVVDLGERTLEVAKSIARMLQGSKGRIVVVEPKPTTGLDAEGLVSASQDKIVAVLRKLAE